MKPFEKFSFGIALAAISSSALAGPLVPTPAPVVGAGIGAVVLAGIGYRALKSRINR
jgi:hypothetical protein